MSKLQAMHAINAHKIGDQLYEISDLCHVTTTIIHLCPDLRVLDFTIVISDAVPFNLQHRWEKIQHYYSQSHQRVRPSFRHIRAVAERIEATRIIQAVHQST